MKTAAELAQEGRVAEAFDSILDQEVPISDLEDPNRLRSERRNLRGMEYEVPYYYLNGEKIWGATAMVLSEFLWILGEDRPEGA